MSVPPGATHANGDAYYKRASGGAYFWCRDRRRWVYMEDASARRALKRAVRLRG